MVNMQMRARATDCFICGCGLLARNAQIRSFKKLNRGYRKNEVLCATRLTESPRRILPKYPMGSRRRFSCAFVTLSEKENENEDFGEGSLNYEVFEEYDWDAEEKEEDDEEDDNDEDDEFLDQFDGWMLDDDVVELQTPLYLEQIIGPMENIDVTRLLKNQNNLEPNNFSEEDKNDFYPPTPLNYLTSDESQFMTSLLMENFTLAPASQIAYFYLHNTLGLSEDTMWKITIECGSVLGLTAINLEKKVNLLKRTMNLSPEDVKVILHKQPTVLQLNPDKNIGPTLSYLVRSLNLSKEDLRSIIVNYPSILCYSIRNLKQKIGFFRNTLGCSIEEARGLIISTPQLLTLSVTSGLGLMAKYNLLRYDVELSEDSIKKIIIANPRILACYSFETNLVPKLIGFFMVRLDMSASQVEKILLQFPELMDRSLEGHLQPFADYFCNEIDFSPQELRSVVLKFPRILSYSISKIKHVAGYFRYEIGLSGTQTKRILYQAPQVICLNDETLRLKMNFLLELLNLDIYELRKIVSGMPSVLKCSMEQNVAPKVSYLLQELNGSIEDVKKIVLLQPTILGYSLKDRIKRRIDQMKVKGIPFSKITIGITMTEEKFQEWLQSEAMSTSEKARRRWRKRIGVLDQDNDTTNDTFRSEPNYGMRVFGEDARIISWTRPPD